MIMFSINSTTDKISPQVTSCPDSKTVFTSTKTKRVFWPEPTFTDNKGVVSVSRSHASGQLFEWGDTVVTYVAKDAFNNVAECTFRIYVTRKENLYFLSIWFELNLSFLEKSVFILSFSGEIHFWRS